MSSKMKRFGGRTETMENISRIVDPRRELAVPVQLLPLKDIEMDAENPRKLLLDGEDLTRIDDDAADAELMRAQLEELQGLAQSIQQNGLIHPVQVYRKGERFVLMTGQRRLLAHRLLGLKSIRASIHDRRPDNLRLQQFIENMQRSEISLYERLMSVRSIFTEAGLHEAPAVEMQAFLQERAGVQRMTAYRYVKALSAPRAVMDAIADGVVRGLKKAVDLCNLPDDQRDSAIAALRAGEEPGAVGEGAVEVNTAPVADLGMRPTPAAVKRARGRPQQYISVSKFDKPQVVRGLMRELLGEDAVPDIDWSDYKQVSHAFGTLLARLEQRYA